MCPQHKSQHLWVCYSTLQKRLWRWVKSQIFKWEECRRLTEWAWCNRGGFWRWKREAEETEKETGWRNHRGRSDVRRWPLEAGKLKENHPYLGILNSRTVGWVRIVQSLRVCDNLLWQQKQALLAIKFCWHMVAQLMVTFLFQFYFYSCVCVCSQRGACRSQKRI